MSNQINKSNSNPNLTAEDYLDWLNANVEKKYHNEMLADFFLLTNDTYSQCIGLEFLYINGYYRELEILILKNEKSKIKRNQEAAYLYQLLLAKRNGTIRYKVLCEIFENLKPKDLFLACIRDFIYIAIHFDLNDYSEIINQFTPLKEKVKYIKNPILVKLFRVRINVFLFHHHWKKNEMLLARKYGFTALNVMIDNYQIANLHLNISLSYIFDSFEFAWFHLLEAKKLAEKHNFIKLNNVIEVNNIPFIYAHFKLPNKLVTSDKSEQAHLALGRGEIDLAKKILSNLKDDSPFTSYYKGWAYEDKRMLLKSYNDFLEEQSDYFFARLPLAKLKII
ncbi:hypothetical protein SAMN04488134_105102 [Amphibacillus marinus]|uniref:Uncharacterized protein n=1 Tax=Amphibacillus marinus TaxID=872970 RepID=A0A1H8N303_9BACI|nr:AimR family lysis-lysogeny pheromone receptor [Amphibacillus marinus]SEO23942.1 hypothetical protein SAMN04488134_105102 [Amphibacillus marinus]